MNSTEAQRMLYDWHSGQGSAVYAAANSGLVEDMPALLLCIEHAQAVCDASRNVEQLRALTTLAGYVQRSVVGPIEASDGKVYLALPWAKVPALTTSFYQPSS